MKIIILAILLCNIVQAKLIDKISAVVNNEIITLSVIKRVQKSLAARRNISPFIYNKESYTDAEITELLIRKNIIRSKLAELGYVISDQQVESEIKDRERKLGLTREQLLQFLNNNNTNYEEFFEITREALEYNIFNSRIIIPLISVSEQEIKNEFFSMNKNNKSITYEYTLVDYIIDKDLSKKKYDDYKKAMVAKRKGTPLPSEFEDISEIRLPDMKADSLDSSIQKILVNAGEGEFTSPLSYNNQTHIFFIEKRNIVDSDSFIQQKNFIKNKIYQDKAVNMTESWFQRESSNYYIKKFL
jgi:peptidyl-prolyl cis-trans isomerase SurA